MKRIVRTALLGITGITMLAGLAGCSNSNRLQGSYVASNVHMNDKMQYHFTPKNLYITHDTFAKQINRKHIQANREVVKSSMQKQYRAWVEKHPKASASKRKAVKKQYRAKARQVIAHNKRVFKMIVRNNRASYDHFADLKIKSEMHRHGIWTLTGHVYNYAPKINKQGFIENSSKKLYKGDSEAGRGIVQFRFKPNASRSKMSSLDNNPKLDDTVFGKDMKQISANTGSKYLTDSYVKPSSEGY